MNPTALNAIDRQVDAAALLKHPFYQAWSRGELTIETLRDYASQYYHHVAAFPTYLSGVHAQCDEIPVRRRLLENLIEEEHGTPNHPELWLDFAGALGLSEQEVVSAMPRAETRALIDTFRRVCGDRGVATGIAALYAYESQIPAVAATKIKGLKNFYGIDSTKDLAYFAVHEEADVEHAAAERELLGAMLPEHGSADVNAGVSEVLYALNEMLSGVFRHNRVGQQPSQSSL